MGNFYSSVKEEADQFKELTQEQEQQTPVASPTDNKFQHLKGTPLPFIDPRSPSQGVSRTPLEIEEKNRRIEKSRINNLINKENNLNKPVQDDEVKTPTGPYPSGKDFFDPRSPNPEINRTPIAISAAADTPKTRKIFQSQNDRK